MQLKKWILRFLQYPNFLIKVFLLILLYQFNGGLNSIGYCSDNIVGAKSYLRTIAIGDIQANKTILTEVLIQAKVISPNGQLFPNTHLILMGDLIGDGPNSPEVIKLIMKLKLESYRINSKITIIAGNHEINLLLNRYNYISKEDRLHWAQWLDLDSDWRESIFNALHLGIDQAGPIEILRAFYKSLVPMAKVGRVLFVHSGISQMMVNTNVPEMTKEFRSKINSILNERDSR